MPNLTGQTLGRYQLLEPLGEGGMAVVYKAFDTRLECEVAVKIIRIENLPQSGVERALKRFEREAKSVARLNHANILKVMDYGEQDGSPYLVMPYLPGGTLKELIKQRGEIPWKEAAQLLLPIAEALGYAHSQGVIHRDIKPSNILLTESGQPMLTDFGVAKIIEDEATQDLTGTSATVGTPEYMAPEQITSKTVDARADLYSLGVVFYEMVTGRKPFQADTPMAVLVMHAHDPLPRPSQFVKNLPENVEHFLLKALTKKPEDRYQSAEEMVKALQSIYTGSAALLKSEPVIPFVKKVDHTQDEISIEKKKAFLRTGLVIGRIILLLGVGILVGILFNKATPASKVDTPTLTETLTFIPTDTQMPEPLITVTPLSTPTNTPELTFTTTPTTQSLFLLVNSNCRNYPDPSGYLLEVIEKGEPIVVNGVNPTKDWTSITYQDQECWIISSNLSESNKIQSLLVITPKPVLMVWNVYAAQNLSYAPVSTSNFQFVSCSYTNVASESRAKILGAQCCAYLRSKYDLNETCVPELVGPYFPLSVDQYEIFYHAPL